ncbi:cytochrome oxidase c assembly-domain-containing protein [Calycina marina]|uniref:Cytochrome oxidase c assembly-domain-containing protein n=1 Tax=Calycina marina TaxID=1763456 RepID=A0A9P8CJ81_9HELO|nr:cytochrome oxidase c assembly-domain-containing protein [Calycina marina]
MSRSAVDATRFTSTTPHASAKSPLSFRHNPHSSSQPPNKPGSIGETPLEKVKRLRAAANAAREAQVTTADKIIIRGRVWADRLHRITALGLIGLTVVAGGVTIYALGDMMIYNRSKRAQYFAQKESLEDTAIAEARAAIQSGTADQRQLDYIALRDAEDERIAAYLNKKKEKKGLYKGTKDFLRDFLFLGLKKEEYNEPLEKYMKSKNEGSTADEGGDIMKSFEDKSNVVSEQAKKAFASEKERQRHGGPLDRLGTPASADDELPRSGGWTSFMTRK